MGRVGSVPKFEISKNRELDRSSKMRFGLGRFRFGSRFRSVLGSFAHPYFQVKPTYQEPGLVTGASASYEEMITRI